MFNKLILVGYVGKVPEMRFTPDGKAVTKFTVATDEGYGDTKRTLWFNITTWEKLAEVCNEHVYKGMRVLIEGKLTEPGAWINKEDSLPRASLEVTANVVKFLSDKQE